MAQNNPINSSQRRRGRAAGSPPNRQAILSAAQQQFIECGYDGATIRGIAKAAGVDPALVMHYFGSKEQLLLATLQNLGQIEAVGPDLLAGGAAGLGERVIRAAFEAYETTYRPLWRAVVGLLRTAIAHEEAARRLREDFSGGGLTYLVEALDQPQPQLRAALVASELLAAMIARYVIRIEPIASADLDSIVAWYGPVIQRYLTEPLPGDVQEGLTDR